MKKKQFVWNRYKAMPRSICLEVTSYKHFRINYKATEVIIGSGNSYQKHGEIAET